MKKSLRLITFAAACGCFLIAHVAHAQQPEKPAKTGEPIIHFNERFVTIKIPVSTGGLMTGCVVNVTKDGEMVYSTSEIVSGRDSNIVISVNFPVSKLKKEGDYLLTVLASNPLNGPGNDTQKLLITGELFSSEKN